jgi:hypothetical protein
MLVNDRGSLCAAAALEGPATYAALSLPPISPSRSLGRGRPECRAFCAAWLEALEVGGLLMGPLQAGRGVTRDRLRLSHEPASARQDLVFAGSVSAETPTLPLGFGQRGLKKWSCSNQHLPRSIRGDCPPL